MQMYDRLQSPYSVLENKCQAAGEQHCLLALLLYNTPSRLWLIVICCSSMTVHNQSPRADEEACSNTSLQGIMLSHACELVHDV